MGTIIIGIVILVACYFAIKHVKKTKSGCSCCPGACHCDHKHEKN
ncbi:Virus attachment protein p12 family [Urinicoccus massiliensis]|uniref:Virus attachment protein p12 family n=1 Tax=Urinicoccus massiliensis TaxID=1723382 RepID=A0A8H2M6S9_9FIRM|nr:Virus attachment protein p12 family [Urinicoccus massiliensis]